MLNNKEKDISVNAMRMDQQEEEEDEDLEDEEEEEEEEDEEEEEEEENVSWVTWYCSIRDHNFFCEVEEAFIQDDFNLTGLSNQVPYYEYALDMILDIDIPYDKISEDKHELIETAAEVLYGLIHARYILTPNGMIKMIEKYQKVDFGRCPLSTCRGQAVLPIGLSDITREYSVEVFCPRCLNTYYPRSSRLANIDGAYFGTTFCHFLLLTYPELIVAKHEEKYVPRIFGFKIHESSPFYRLRDPNLQQQKKKTKQKDGNGNVTTSSTTPSNNNVNAVVNLPSTATTSSNITTNPVTANVAGI